MQATPKAIAMRAAMVIPSQKAEKLPAVRPERTLRDAPPSLAGVDNFFDMAAVGAGEDFHEFGDERAGGGAAGDDGGEFPPELSAAQVGDQNIGEDVGGGDGDEARQEDEHGEGILEIHFIGKGIFGVGEAFVDEVGDAAGQQHDQAHGEDPDEQLGLNGRGAGEEDEGDECDTGDAVGFETIGGGAARNRRRCRRCSRR